MRHRAVMRRKSVPRLDSRLVVPSLVWLVASAGAAAANPDEPTARSNGLFAEGKRLLSKGDVPAACARFAESHRLAPRGGTLLNLGLCHEREGKLEDARRELAEALIRAQKDGRADREPIAREHLAAVESRLAGARQELLETAEDLLGRGQLAEACALARTALATTSEAPEVLRFLGRCHMRIRRPREGRDFYRRYLALVPAARDAALVRAIVEEGPP
jgi:Flp pilus assembly protein TadD